MTVTEHGGWMTALKDDLRSGIDRTDALDDLFQLTFSCGAEDMEDASYCLARMARNGCADMRIQSILMSMRGYSDRVSENICWGLGELVSAGIADSDGLEYAVGMMSSDTPSLRATAAWCIGRMWDMDLTSDAAQRVLQDASEDESPLVRAFGAQGGTR